MMIVYFFYFVQFFFLLVVFLLLLLLLFFMFINIFFPSNIFCYGLDYSFTHTKQNWRKPNVLLGNHLTTVCLTQRQMGPASVYVVYVFYFLLSHFLTKIPNQRQKLNRRSEKTKPSFNRKKAFSYFFFRGRRRSVFHNNLHKFACVPI